jgi:hypothetical protein
MPPNSASYSRAPRRRRRAAADELAPRLFQKRAGDRRFGHGDLKRLEQRRIGRRVPERASRP